MPVEYGYGWETYTATMPPELIAIMILLPAIAIAFSILAFIRRNPEDAANTRGMISATLASITWFIFEGFFAFCFPVLPYIYISYLWFVMGLIFAALAVVYVILYVSAGFKSKQNEGTLHLQQNEGY